MNTIDFALIFKALGDSTRLRIVEMLSDGEMCACKILEQFEITQPTLSHHMRILCECGLVSARREGKWSYYLIDENIAAEFKAYINSIVSPKGGGNI